MIVGSGAQREGDAVVAAVLVRKAEARAQRDLGAHDAVAAVEIGGLREASRIFTGRWRPAQPAARYFNILMTPTSLCFGVITAEQSADRCL